jgi:hypothetical protein
MFREKTVEEIKTHILYSVTFFPENRAFCEIMWKNFCRMGQATNNKMAQAHCMLDN